MISYKHYDISAYNSNVLNICSLAEHDIWVIDSNASQTHNNNGNINTNNK